MKFFTVLLMSLSAYSLTGIHLRSLVDVSSRKLVLKSNKARAIVVFQKDCSACRRQVQDLNCLKEQAEVLLVGLFSSENDLRKEFRSFGTNFEAYYGGKEFKENFGVNEELTPQIIVSKNSQKELILGYSPCKNILNKIKEMKK